MSAIGWSNPTATSSQPTGKVLFTSGSSVTIDAPAKVVFDAITSFSQYSKWNTWTPTLKFEKTDGEVSAGQTGLLKTRMEAQNREYDIPVEILTLDRRPEEYRLEWRSKLLPWWALTAERVQVVTAAVGDDVRSQVRTWESMSGPAAYVFKYMMGTPEQLNAANVNYLNELKAFVEKRSNT